MIVTSEPLAADRISVQYMNIALYLENTRYILFILCLLIGVPFGSIFFILYTDTFRNIFKNLYRTVLLVELSSLQFLCIFCTPKTK